MFERRTLERYRPVEHVETAAEALAVSLNERGEINWPRMEPLTGRNDAAAAARAGRPRLPQPGRRRLGNRRPLPERRRAGEAERRGSGGRARSLVPAQRRSPERGAAGRPGAGGHRGQARRRRGYRQTDIRDFVAALLDMPPGDVKVAHAGGDRHLDGRGRSYVARSRSATRRRTARRASPPSS